MNHIEAGGTTAVIGAGTMGGGIALAFALGGHDVKLAARRNQSLAGAVERAGTSLRLLQQAGNITEEHALNSMDRIATTTNVEDAVRDAHLVIESIPERLADKRELLTVVERAAPPDAVITTNTSSLSVDALAQALNKPERFAGFHWFNPPEFVELVEVVSGSATDDETVERLIAQTRAIGKAVVHVRRDVPGFIANRLQYALLRESFALVSAGVCAYDEIDQAVKAGLGARWAAVGPIESLDLAGLDVHLVVAEKLYPELAENRHPAPEVVKLVQQGALGCKTGRGLYGAYEPERVAELTKRRDLFLLGIADLRRRLH